MKTHGSQTRGLRRVDATTQGLRPAFYNTGRTRREHVLRITLTHEREDRVKDVLERGGEPALSNKT